MQYWYMLMCIKLVPYAKLLFSLLSGSIMAVGLL